MVATTCVINFRHSALKTKSSLIPKNGKFQTVRFEFVTPRTGMLPLLRRPSGLTARQIWRAIYVILCIFCARPTPPTAHTICYIISTSCLHSHSANSGIRSSSSAPKCRKKIVDGRFTYKVGNWSPSLNLYMDAPWKETSRGELLADQSIASLILSEARGRHHNGKSFQLFSKIQSSERNQCVWHFQCRKEDSGLARHWLDSRLIPFLSNQFSHERNKEDGNLSFKMLGTPTRITTDGSGTGSVHAYNGSTEAYLDMCKSIISKKRWTNLRG